MKFDFSSATTASAAEAFEREFRPRNVAILPNLRVFKDGQELKADEIKWMGDVTPDESEGGLGASIYALIRAGTIVGKYTVDAFNSSTVVHAWEETWKEKREYDET